MFTIRRIGLAVGLLAALTIAWSQIALVLAAPTPKVGVAYQTSGGNSIGAANYVVIADMVVPAGKYHITARGTVNNQTGTTVDAVACNAYAGTASVDSGTTSAANQYAGFAVDGTGDLPNGGTIRVECISGSVMTSYPTVGISLVAESVAGIVALP